MYSSPLKLPSSVSESRIKQESVNAEWLQHPSFVDSQQSGHCCFLKEVSGGGVKVTRGMRQESEDNFKYNSFPCESELAAAFIDRKKREGSARGFGLRLRQFTKGSDSWVDDPITRYITSLHINNEEKSDIYLLWPLVLQLKGPYTVLVLPLIEPHHLKTYSRMCNSSDRGSAIREQENIS
ncbi:AP-5 complex subunit mu-like [Primulina huaijiensis]|uniref:AP-5 complex subunit mu-like n=1 Tax=Primulina huaijiensis TaxID=1492673 RepID=UPI003CC72483